METADEVGLGLAQCMSYVDDQELSAFIRESGGQQLIAFLSGYRHSVQTEHFIQSQEVAKQLVAEIETLIGRIRNHPTQMALYPQGPDSAETNFEVIDLHASE